MTTMQFKSILLTGIAVLLTTLAFGQPTEGSYPTRKTVSGAAKKAFEKGMDFNFAGENEKAIREFEKALKEIPNFIDAQLQWAAMKADLNLYREAEIGFEKVIEIDPLYNTKVLYTLGIAETQQEKFGEAAEHFQQYLDTESKNESLRSKAKRHLANCTFRHEVGNKRVPFDPQDIGDNINTPANEYLPSLTADGSTLVYTRVVKDENGDPHEDFYISRKVESGWRKGRPLEDINTGYSEGAQSISADGKFLVFTACNRKGGFGSCDLYFSEVKNDRWTKPANMGEPINSSGWESQPSISADGKTLYFTWVPPRKRHQRSNNKEDIRVSYRQADGSWSKPVGLGSEINTPYSDQSPFIHPDGKTLYFMSNGHPGFGSYDLFYSRMQEDGTWGRPRNLGFPINTAGAEGAMVISLDGKTVYFSTDRVDPGVDGLSAFDKPATKGNSDIYFFELYEEARPLPLTYRQARVYDAETKKPLTANVEFVELIQSKTHVSSITDEDGEFLVCLPLGNNYALNVSKEGYLFHSENFALINRKSGKPYVLEIALRKIPKSMRPNPEVSTPIPASEPIVLKNVFFDTGSADLRSESYTELRNLKELLEKNPSMKIQVNGHTDNVGSEEANQKLSANRAKSVYEFLVQEGINASRMSFKGFGESQSIDSNENSEGRQRNRRTEFMIIGI